MAVFEVWDEWSFLIGSNIGGYFGTMGQLGFDTTVYGSLAALVHSRRLLLGRPQHDAHDGKLGST